MSTSLMLRRPSLASPAEQRRSAGKALRQQVPRSWHASWAPEADRADPIALLRRSDRDRLKSLLPIRYGRMLASPAAFLRGAAIIMAHDLIRTPVTGLRGWICGDAHLNNFGGFATPERNFIFDVNDFDEAFLGPWEWDIKRLAASLVVAARVNGVNGDSCHAAAEACARSYRLRTRLAAMRFLDTWYCRLTRPTRMRFRQQARHPASGPGRTADKRRNTAKAGSANEWRIPNRRRPTPCVAYHPVAGKSAAGGLVSVSGNAIRGPAAAARSVSD